MIEDLPLFAPKQDSLYSKFLRFHAENPHVYRLLVSLAREWNRKTNGRPLGIKALFERARWEFGLQTQGDEYSLNNNYTAFYARLIMSREQDLNGMFSLRKQKKPNPIQISTCN